MGVQADTTNMLTVTNSFYHDGWKWTNVIKTVTVVKTNGTTNQTPTVLTNTTPIKP